MVRRALTAYKTTNNGQTAMYLLCPTKGCQMFLHYIGKEILNHSFYCKHCDSTYTVTTVLSEGVSTYRLVLEKGEF